MQFFDYIDKFLDLIIKIIPYTDTIMIVLLIACGLYYSFLLRFVQFSMLRYVFGIIFKEGVKNEGKERNVSPFEALMISTASRVGIGTIAGIAFAITAGGPGSLFWMWLMAFFGGASAFAESTLAQIYKSKDETGGFKGGPAYYIHKALGLKWLGIAFAICLIITYAYGFNALQSYTMTSAFAVYYDMFNTSSISFSQSLYPIFIGIALSIFAIWMFFSHHSKIGKISSLIVPFMALAYILLAFIAVCMNLEKIPAVLALIFENAFDFKAIFGGFAGSALVIGIKRGLFANEAGMGSAPNAAAAALTSHPAKQGVIQSFAVFIDVIICTCTGFLVLFSMAYFNNLGIDGKPILTALPLVQEAMKEYYGSFGLHFVSVAIVLFAITSLIGNYYYAQANIKYLTKSNLAMNLFRISAVAMIFIGANLNLKAWALADFTMAFMATTNIISLLLLGKIVHKVMVDFDTQKKAKKDPIFKPETLGIKNTECW